MEENTTRNMKAVFAVVERGQPNGVTRSYWTRIGVGFVNRDGSINLRLDAFPVSGNLQVRDWEERRSDTTDQPYAGGSVRPRPRQGVAQPPGTPPTGESLL
jgi:hypothetical protein